MDIKRDLARVALQEERLRFARFDASVAWQLGSWLREAALALGKAIAVDITLNDSLLFYATFPGATPNNADWIRRKKNVLGRFHKSTYAVALDCKRDQTTLEASVGAPLADFVAAGGCFPIRITGSDAVVGSITVSGLPDREDHELAVRCLAAHLGVDLASVALDAPAPSTG